jgi:hypothetical protein
MMDAVTNADAAATTVIVTVVVIEIDPFLGIMVVDELFSALSATDDWRS